MNPTSSEPRLSKSTTRTRYREMETAKNRTGIADFIRERLTERFIDPVDSTPREQKHGFTTMALSCLLVETLESFWHGWPDYGHSAAARGGMLARLKREEPRSIRKVPQPGWPVSGICAPCEKFLLRSSVRTSSPRRDNARLARREERTIVCRENADDKRHCVPSPTRPRNQCIRRDASDVGLGSEALEKIPR